MCADFLPALIRSQRRALSGVLRDPVSMSEGGTFVSQPWRLRAIQALCQLSYSPEMADLQGMKVCVTADTTRIL
jgi:hypothetical protein